MVSFRLENGEKKLGVVFGGTGTIGGTIVNYFKAKTPELVDIRAPSSKKVSLRECNDIREYLFTVRPDFIINAAIANINADSQLIYEVNYLGAINIARVAAALKVPYIFFSSAATLPSGTNLKETDQLPLASRLGNYAKSKIMAEQTLRYIAERHGLDYTVVRLATVYGAHDHKIQGLHRLIFCIADRSMPFILTKKGVVHSYSSSRKLPYLIHHMLNNRHEFGGGIYHFVDREPVEFVRLILTIKSNLGVSRPKEVFIPYTLARTGRRGVKIIQRMLTSIGLKTVLPAELMFLKAFYRTQTLSGKRLAASSFIDPLPEESVFSRLPEMITYYLTRWSLQNLISNFDDKITGLNATIKKNFRYYPQGLLDAIHLSAAEPFQEMSACRLDSRQLYVAD